MSSTPRYESPAFIVGLDSLQGLQVARLLSTRGVPVIGVAKDRQHYGLRTNAVDQIHYTNTASHELIDLLEELGPDLPTKAVLIPCQDKNVLIVSKYRERLKEWYHVVLPDDEIVQQLTDKVQFYSFAEGAGLDIPSTYEISSIEDARHVGASAHFPLVVKPPNRAWGWNRVTRKKALKVSTPAELLEVFSQFHDDVPVLLAQEWIEGTDGDLITCNVYFDRSGVERASFVSQKIRQYPPHLGQACLSVSVDSDEVATATRRFYEQVGLRGFGYLEMKRDSVSGRLVAIEPNVGRPTGRSASAEAAGVELHLTMYLDAVGAPIPPTATQSPSPIKWIHLLRDLQSAVYYMRRGELSVLEWIRSLRGKKVYAVLSWRDPKPFLFALRRSGSVMVSPRERGQITRSG